MATIVNNTSPSSEGTNYGLIIGVILLILVLLVLAVYGRTAFSRTAPASESTTPVQMNQTQEAPAQAPAGDQGSSDINIDVPENLPDVNVPENIDVDVNQGQ